MSSSSKQSSEKHRSSGVHLRSELTAVGDRTVEIVLLGRGNPPIVLESGLGDDYSSWSSVLESLAERGRTLAYSRAGLGGSSAVEAPRDLLTEARELDELLRRLNLPPPYVLLGHSWGGLIVQVYAALHREKVAGLVLVDPAHPDLIEQLERDTPEDARAFRAQTRSYDGATRGELEALSVSRGGHLPRESEPFGGPMLILGAWMFDFNQSAAFRESHRKRIIDIAATYPQAELRKIACAHRIHVERPLALLDAVDEVLARVAARQESR